MSRRLETCLRRFDPGATPGRHPLWETYDESILQQGRFWMRTVTWTLIGTTVFGVAWLALARTEEIVVAPGQLEPIGSVQDIQMPLGGVADQILVEGRVITVKAGQVLMKLDTEASEEQRNSLEKTIEAQEGAVDAQTGGETQLLEGQPRRGADV